MPRDDWRRVDSKHPCTKCGKDGWCQYTPNGAVMCMRVADGGQHHVDCNGQDYWIHRPGGASASSPCDPDAIADPAPECATLEIRDRVYTALLSALTLEPGHRADLRRRGMSDAEIDRRGYRSLPIGKPRWRVAAALAARFGPDLATVPGFYQGKSDSGRVYWTWGGPPGFAIPVRCLDARIVALQIRPDVIDGGAKYLYLSSSRHGGPGPGAPVHVPLSMPGTPDPYGGTVAIVEGIMKSDCVTVLDPARLPVIGIPGHAAWRSALPILGQLAPQTVRYRADPDAWTKEPVGRSLKAFVRMLKSHGYAIELGRFRGVNET